MKPVYKILGLLIFLPFFTRAQNSANPDKIFFYGSAAVNIVTNTPGSTSPYAAAGGKAYTSYMPAFTFGFSAPSDPEIGRVCFRAEASVSFSKYNSLYKNQVYPYTDFRASFNEMSIGLTPQVIYNFYNAEHLKIYAGAGLNIAKPIYTNTYYGAQDPSVSFRPDNEYTFIGFDTRLLLKGGIQVHKHLEVFYNYLTNAQTTNRGYFQLNKNTSQIGVNYIL
jgi:hypothetical protein